MKTELDTRIQAAIDRVDGSVTEDGNSVIYFDDSTRKHYLADIADMDDLADLMESDDEDVARDAYSHWCGLYGHPECDAEGKLFGE